MSKLLVLIGCVSLVCGGSYPIKPFIIEGESVPDSEKFPVASIQLDGKHICGGSILKPSMEPGASPDKKFILTAAQCVHGLESTPQRLSVMVGSLKLSGKDGETVKAVKIHVHPKYDPFDLLNDIAIVEVNKIVADDTKVPTATIEEKTNTQYSIIGWGRSTQEDQISDDLRFLSQEVLDDAHCQSYKPAGTITANQLCAIYKLASGNGSDKGACIGDAGSPLMVDKQVGIASWGHGCALGKPDVYTYVFPYLNEFIKPIIDAKVQ